MARQIANDPFLRALAQVVLVAMVVALALVCVATAAVALSKPNSWLDSEQKRFAIRLFDFLSVPFGTVFGQFAIVLGSIVPVVLASVCYETRIAAPSPDADRGLNAIGRAVVLVALIGILAAALALILIAMDADRIMDLGLVQSDLDDSSTTIAAIMSYQAIYLAQLTGLKPK